MLVKKLFEAGNTLAGALQFQIEAVQPASPRDSSTHCNAWKPGSGAGRSGVSRGKFSVDTSFSQLTSCRPQSHGSTDEFSWSARDRQTARPRSREPAGALVKRLGAHR
jgi:hypothetical protein